MSERTAWEQIIWTPEPLFHGETVFCLASGPSLTQEIADKLRGRRVAVANSSVRFAPWADVWFFTDNNVFEDNRDLVAAFPGHVITFSRVAKREMPLKIKRVKGEWLPHFPPVGSEKIRQGRSTGHSMVSCMIACGAIQIVLCGYDMRVVDGREHHHDEYVGRPRDLDIYAREFVPGFDGWRAAAQRAGCDIVNATPGSAIQEFPFVDLDDVLMKRAA